MFLRLLTDTVFPTRSLGVWIGESSGTSTAPKSGRSPADEVPLVTNSSGSPWSAPTMSDTTLPKAKSKSPLTTPGTAAAPPVVVVISRSMSSSSKNPFSLPSQIGAVSTMGMTPTFTFVPPSASVSGESPPPQAATRVRAAAARAAVAVRRMVLLGLYGGGPADGESQNG